ncbi:hypothetical protein [Aquimarina sp. 2201CG5-10]|uniref:hypothetical protein n=1 Tax=Aquimarina callyspongiae TaxID=3098150 RepID=UPI002AC8EB89|nr:hypothetical protein [Aquimarina sp. 2201CG5-10]
MFYFLKEFSRVKKEKKNKDRKIQKIIDTKEKLEYRLRVLESIEKELRELEQ